MTKEDEARLAGLRADKRGGDVAFVMRLLDEQTKLTNGCVDALAAMSGKLTEIKAAADWVGTEECSNWVKHECRNRPELAPDIHLFCSLLRDKLAAIRARAEQPAAEFHAIGNPPPELLRMMQDEYKRLGLATAPEQSAVPTHTEGPEKGLYRKFRVTRVDESPKHDGCEYFVLDWAHDPFAVPAALAYAAACEATRPTLARDLRHLAVAYRKTGGGSLLCGASSPQGGSSCTLPLGHRYLHAEGQFAWPDSECASAAPQGGGSKEGSERRCPDVGQTVDVETSPGEWVSAEVEESRSDGFRWVHEVPARSSKSIVRRLRGYTPWRARWRWPAAAAPVKKP